MTIALNKSTVNKRDSTFVQKPIKPSGSWRNIKTHYLSVLEEPWYKTILELQHLISLETMLFYEEKKMKTLHLPVTTGSISSPMGLGSDSIPVKVNICKVDTFLADSMQFMLEYACRLYERGCYYLMPSFRGELADKRHLCQFYHSEAEILGTLDDVINLVEDYIKYLCNSLLVKIPDAIYNITGDLSHIEKLASCNRIPRITLDEAIQILDDNFDGKQTYDVERLGFRVLNHYGERRLIEIFDGFVWVTNYDHLSVPFYQAFSDNNKTKALNADLLFGIGEVVGAGERHQTEEEVLEALKIHSVDPAEYEWYFTLKKKHPLKTSGFGLGIERLMLWILKHDDIRDCQILPRFNGINIVP